MTRPCPTPGKYRHATRAATLAARESLEAARGIDLALKPYLCRCGCWHLGHSSLHQLEKALASGRAATRATRRRRKR